MSSYSDLLEKIIAFRNERDWSQFHNPKDLAAGLAIEAAELQEIFLWKNQEEVDELIEAKISRISEELADITWFLLLLSHELNIDLSEAVENKLVLNAQKYPADKVSGSSRKYDEYDNESPHSEE